MKIVSNANNPATLRLLIAADLGHVPVTLEIISVKGNVISSMSHSYCANNLSSIVNELYLIFRLETVWCETPSRVRTRRWNSYIF